LASRGVEYLFANGGTDFAPVVEAYAKGQKLGWKLPQVVIVPHENMGVAMAHGYTMITGRPQAMMVHVGVGTANALTGLINASRQNIDPVLPGVRRSPSRARARRATTTSTGRRSTSTRAACCASS
jgi:acetolactate synthase-1/2/3 large subunit